MISLKLVFAGAVLRRHNKEPVDALDSLCLQIKESINLTPINLTPTARLNSDAISI
jgi:hypothetical protein